MATRLEDLVIDRVDLVDNGANPHAHVLLFKRAERGRITQIVVDGTLARDLRVAKADARGRVPAVVVDDQGDPQAWADVLAPAVQYVGGDLHVGYRQNLKREAILKVAGMLPTTVTRYVYVPLSSGPLIAYPGQTIAQAAEPVGRTYETYIAKWGGSPMQKGRTMDMLTPEETETIAKGVAGADVVVLRKCRTAFPEQVQVTKRDLRAGGISADEDNELQMLDPDGRLSLDERAMHLAARRWPALYEGYAAALSRGIA